MNAWILYRWRFIFTSDIAGALSSFGGIAAQPDRLSIARRLSAAESIATSLAYDSLFSAHLEELARARAGLNAGAPRLRIRIRILVSEWVSDFQASRICPNS